MDVKRNQLKRQRNEARRDMENTRDDLQAELRSFEDQHAEEREEIQRDALQCREFFEKMIANQALQIKSLQNELEESREAKAIMEVNFNKTVSTKTTLIEEQASSMRSMRERESCHHDRLNSEENLAIGTIKSQLRQRVEAMEAKKREAIEQWEIERAHLRQELTRAQAGEARYRSQLQREEGEVRDTSRVSGSSNRITSSTAGVSRGLFGGANTLRQQQRASGYSDRAE